MTPVVKPEDMLYRMASTYTSDPIVYMIPVRLVIYSILIESWFMNQPVFSIQTNRMNTIITNVVFIQNNHGWFNGLDDSFYLELFETVAKNVKSDWFLI